LIISESEPLFEVFDHLLNLPPLCVIFDHVDGRQMKVRTDQINGFLSLLFDDHNRHFSQILNLSDEPGDLESLGFPVHQKGNLPIGRSEGQQGGHFRFLPINPKVRIGLKLRDHMIAASPTDLDQSLCPVPTIGQYVEFTRDGKLKFFNDSFCQLNLCTEIATSLGPLGMIEFGPKGQEEVPIKQR
jgi:hypothetical protein